MRRRIGVVALMLAAACGGGGGEGGDGGVAGELTPAEARAALPGRSALRVALPERAGGVAAEREALQDARAVAQMDGKVANGADVSSELAAVLDEVVGGVIGMIEEATSADPAACAGTTCTWRPAPGPEDALAVELTVTREDDPLRYGWNLRAAARGGAASLTTVATGSFVPGDAPGKGSGSFSFDLAAIAQLGEAPPAQLAAAAVEVAYSSVGPLVLECRLVALPGILSEDGVASLAYRIVEDDAGGDFQVAAREAATGSELELRVRWLASGAGRSAVTAQGEGTSLRLAECWNEGLQTVYLSMTMPPMPAIEEGAQSSCAFPASAVEVELEPPVVPST